MICLLSLQFHSLSEPEVIIVKSYIKILHVLNVVILSIVINILINMSPIYNEQKY